MNEELPYGPITDVVPYRDDSEIYQLDKIKFVLEINSKRCVILPENPYMSAVCDVDDDPNPLTKEEKILIIEWLEMWFIKEKKSWLWWLTKK